LISRINTPELQNRKDHVENIFDSLMDIADEYQAVMVEDEEDRYWESMDLWDDEVKQRNALTWVNSSIENK